MISALPWVVVLLLFYTLLSLILLWGNFIRCSSETNYQRLVVMSTRVAVSQTTLSGSSHYHCTHSVVLVAGSVAFEPPNFLIELQFALNPDARRIYCR